MHFVSRCVARSCLCLVVACAAGNSAVAGDLVTSTRVLAATGQEAVGAQGAAFSLLSTAMLGDVGTIAFAAELAGEGVTSSNRVGVWRISPSGLSLVARTGNPQPGLGTNFRSNLILTDVAGSDVFFENRPTSTGLVSAWLSQPSSPDAQLIAIQGQQVDGHTLRGPSGTRAAGGGTAIFGAGNELTNVASIFKAVPGSVAPIAQYRGAVPGVPGADFVGMDTPYSRGGTSGVFAFRGQYEVGEGGPQNGGFWAGTSTSSPNLIAKVGDQIPGAAPGTTFDGFGTTVLNNGGMFAVSTVARTAQGAQQYALLVGTPTSSHAIIGPGVTVPVVPAGSLVGTEPRDMNDLGEVLVNGSTGSNAAYFVGSGGGYRRVVVNGQAPENRPDLHAFVSNDTGQYLLNSAGISAINVRLIGLPTFNPSLLIQSPGHGLQVIASPGDAFELAPGDVRTIDYVELRDLNDRSELLYWLRFTDQTQALVVSTVPVPSSAILCFGSMAMLCGLRRRRH